MYEVRLLEGPVKRFPCRVMKIGTQCGNHLQPEVARLLELLGKCLVLA